MYSLQVRARSPRAGPVPVQPERGLRRLFSDGLILHSDGGHDLRVRADFLCGRVPPRQDDRD